MKLIIFTNSAKILLIFIVVGNLNNNIHHCFCSPSTNFTTPESNELRPVQHENNNINATSKNNRTTNGGTNWRSFALDFQRNTFVKDGKDFRYISGSFHYFRSVPEYWDDIMVKFRQAGLNAIQTYVEWSSHQPSPAEEYNFDGNLNLFKFLDTATKNNLLVILRPGPFIDAERDMGGLPAWLLWQKQNMSLRSNDLEYIYFVSRWFDHLLPKLKPYLYSNGGPIIMIQVENEYGSFSCDKQYPMFLRDLITLHLGEDVVLFTTDGNGDSYLKCGSLPDVYPTIDFGPEKSLAVNKSFSTQRKFAPKGPLINSEFYPGWLDHWGYSHSTQRSSDVASTLDSMLAFGANVNIYMFYGGTSFGYGSGSNIDGSSFDSCPTSYDYDAPLSEARDPTIKYFLLKDTISKYIKVPTEDPIFSTKANYGEIKLRKFGHVLNSEFLEVFGNKAVSSSRPLSFEELKVGSGFVLYTTKLNFKVTDPTELSIPDLKDRAYVYVNQRFAGILSRGQKIFTMPIHIRERQKLEILVENQGRVCFGSQIGEHKGLGNEVKLGERSLTNQIWKMYKIGEMNGKKLTKYGAYYRNSTGQAEKILSSEGQGFYIGQFNISRNETNTTTGYPLDTFVRVDGWSKGMIWINGFNLGRYWPVMGPQETLYLPGPLLKFSPVINKLVLLELEFGPESCSTRCESEISSNCHNCSISLTDVHVIDGQTPIRNSAFEMSLILK